MINFFRNHWFSKTVSIVLTVLLLNLSGCYYYKVRPAVDSSTEVVKEQQDLNKFLVLHHGENVWDFTDITIDGQIISGELNQFTEHEMYKTTDPNRANRYRPKKFPEENAVINEVHIYISEYSETVNGRVSISPESIERIDVYDRDTAATVSSWIFTGVLIGAGVFALMMIIVLLTKSSCPFIYTWNGEFFEFTGEIYSGAIQPALERHDYLPLPGLKPDNGIYKIKMSNEVREIQHTNLTELIVFDHPSSTGVLIDKYGDYHTISNMVPPFEATNLDGKNILNYVFKKDSLNYFGDAITKDQSVNDGIIMKFIIPENAGSAKLVINAKNSLWLDYLFSRFHEMFGEDYNNFQAKQRDATHKELNKWYLEQNIPLSIYIENNGDWEFVDYYNLIGPMAFKEDIIKFDIPANGSDEITIKLETGYLFWEIDFLAIDFSIDRTIDYRVIPVNSAVDNKSMDIKSTLLKDDNEYYVQQDIGDEAILNFKVPDITDESQTVFLHSKGYYIILRDLEGKANKKVLKGFRKKGRFSEYSIEIFNEFRNSMEDRTK